MEHNLINFHKNSFDYVTMYMWIAEMSDITLNDKLIFSVIFNYCKSKNHKYFGTVAYLSKQTGMCNRSVCKSLKNLQEHNLITKIRTGNSFTHAANGFVLNENEIYARTGLSIEQLNKLTIEALQNRILDFEKTIQQIQSENKEFEKSFYSFVYEEPDDLEKIEEELESSNDKPVNKPNPIVMDFTISKKNGFLHSAVKRQPKENKDNKFTQFVTYAKDCKYPNSVMELVVKYVKWLLSNRKVTFDQWKTTIDALNSDLNRLPKHVREEALLDAFNTSYASGFQKIQIDRYKYGRFMATSSDGAKFDNQTSVSSVEAVANGVYKIVSEDKDFVLDENGNIITF